MRTAWWVQAVTGNLELLPPGNTSKGLDHNILFNYIDKVGHTMHWNPFKVSHPATYCTASLHPCRTKGRRHARDHEIT